MQTCHWRVVVECYGSDDYISDEVCSNPDNSTLGVHLVNNVHQEQLLRGGRGSFMFPFLTVPLYFKTTDLFPTAFLYRLSLFVVSVP